MFELPSHKIHRKFTSAYLLCDKASLKHTKNGVNQIRSVSLNFSFDWRNCHLDQSYIQLKLGFEIVTGTRALSTVLNQPLTRNELTSVSILKQNAKI